MKQYSRHDAKAYARAHMKGIWAAALVPFNDDLAIDERAFRRNLRHWIDELGIDGIFVAGKQSEFFSMSLAERKRIVEITVDEIGKKAGVVASCSDQNMDTVIELARHAQAVGTPYIVVHAPVLHFLTARDETLYRYYKTISEQVDIGIAMWSHKDSGYLMSSGAVRADRRAAEYSSHQIQRAAPHVRSAHAHGGRQNPGQYGIGSRVVRQYRRAGLAALSLLVAALFISDQMRPPHA